MKNKSKFPNKKITAFGYTFDSKVCEYCGLTFYRRDDHQTTHWRKQRFCNHKCSRSAQILPFQDCFWNKVDKSGEGGCWLWTAAKNKQGYGLIKATSIGMPRSAKAHRVSFYLENGFLPKVVMHTCDNPTCVNPNHLKGGTHKDNTRDMFEKNRHHCRHGENCSMTILTESQVINIRARYKDGERVCDLSKDKNLCVGYHAIWNICKRKTWKHIL